VESRWTVATTLGLSDPALIAVLTFVTAVGKGLWEAYKYFRAEREAKERTREAEVTKAMEAKNDEIAELRALLRDVGIERRTRQRR
jgi:F0F1-type ATP synthase delta subunit